MELLNGALKRAMVVLKLEEQTGHSDTKGVRTLHTGFS